MPFSDSYANNILNYLFAKTASLTAPSAVYIGLSKNDPEAAGGTFDELSGKGYARVLIAQKGETYPNVIGSASGRAITNTYQINWTKATANWDLVNGFGLFDNANAGSGTPFFYGKLDLTDDEIVQGGKLVESGAVALFDPGALRISFPTTDETASATAE